LEALSGTITHPAWKDKPTWYIITTKDKIVPLSLQRTMAERANAHIKEIAGSHAVYISKPKAVAKVIEEAAQNAGSDKKIKAKHSLPARLLESARYMPIAWHL
jgi:ribosomal protein S2